MRTNRIAITILIANVFLFFAQSTLAFYNAQTGRWPNRDPLADSVFFRDTIRDRRTKQLKQINTKFLVSVYGYVANNTINDVDPLGLDVYKIILNAPNAQLCGCAKHRIIIGDDGCGGSYTVELLGTGGTTCCARFHGSGTTKYRHNPYSAKQQHDRYIGSGDSPDGEVSTRGNSDVDLILDGEAAVLDGQTQNYTFIWNDCGTFANTFIDRANELMNNPPPAPPYPMPN